MTDQLSTPSTQQVRETYARALRANGDAATAGVHEQAFDRWLFRQTHRGSILRLEDLEMLPAGALVLATTPDQLAPVVFFKTHDGSWTIYGSDPSAPYYSSTELATGWKYGALSLIWSSGSATH
ncbi:MAG TPA: hypothetical protein VFU07_05070 [Candidatus Lumbricidophila sp.]|nr:hypothetical protein [Candidatus Lumbricidophila sp.]